MTVLHEGSIFEYDDASPSTTTSGSKTTSAHTWKYCPYSTQITTYNQDTRVPEIEKVFHPETGGGMHSYSLGGILGWVCADNACSYFLSTATTEVDQHGRRFTTAPGTRASEETFATFSGTVQHIVQSRLIQSNVRQRYYEI